MAKLGAAGHVATSISFPSTVVSKFPRPAAELG